MQHYTTISNCRICGSPKIKEVLQFDSQYLHSLFVKENNHTLSNIKFPLNVVLCKQCGLLQLKHTINPELMYTNYYYRSSVNNTMKNDLQDVVKCSLEKVEIKDGEIVLDIACNDAYMIQLYPNNFTRIGIDPAKNIDWSNVDKSVKIINDYFSEKNVRNIIGDKKIKLITCCAMWYDLDKPNVATRDIKRLLAKDGIAVIQVSYLLDTIKDMNYYDITMEHLLYYSYESFKYLMNRNGLEIFDCELNKVNGGSIRFYVTHSENEVPASLNCKNVLQEEEKYHLRDIKTYREFKKKISTNTKLILDYICQEKENGLIIGLGASTKSNMLIQACGLSKDLLSVISERSELKIGLKTLGTDIKLISEQEARNLNPICMFVLPWNFLKEIKEKESDYINGGGKFLLAMPMPYVLDKSGEWKLKRCCKCKKILTINMFCKNKSRKDGIHIICNACVKEYFKTGVGKEAKLKSSSKYFKTTRGLEVLKRSHLKIRYGITLEEYNKILEKQGGGCLVCGDDKRLCMDHNHITGQFRGILCDRCNKCLGLLKEDVQLLKKIINYIEEKNK